VRVKCRLCLVDTNLTPEEAKDMQGSHSRLQRNEKELDLVIDESICASVRIEDKRVLNLIETMESLIAEEVRVDVLDLGSDIDISGTLGKELGCLKALR